MQLTIHEREKLEISLAAIVARRRLDRGVKLNYPETVALISAFVLEGARDGKTVPELQRDGAGVLKRDQVMEGMADMVAVLQVEATFTDGSRLVTLHKPVR